MNLYAKLNREVTFGKIICDTTADGAIIMVDRDNEDCKIIRVTDSNNNIRYELAFNQGNLVYKYLDANGVQIKSKILG